MKLAELKTIANRSDDAERYSAHVHCAGVESDASTKRSGSAPVATATAAPTMCLIWCSTKESASTSSRTAASRLGPTRTTSLASNLHQKKNKLQQASAAVLRPGPEPTRTTSLASNLQQSWNWCPLLVVGTYRSAAAVCCDTATRANRHAKRCIMKLYAQIVCSAGSRTTENAPPHPPPVRPEDLAPSCLNVVPRELQLERPPLVAVPVFERLLVRKRI
jgi:hypothetical protein